MSNPTEKSTLAGSESLTTETHPTREEIELRAYQIYFERGGAHGHDVDDWLEAERELYEKYANTGRMAKAATVGTTGCPEMQNGELRAAPRLLSP